MLRGAVLLSLIGSVAASTVCSILDPVVELLPEVLGCSCEPAESGVGGTATCAQSTPEVAIPLLGTVPAITITLGAELLPCEMPAKAGAHVSISLPSLITESELTMAALESAVAVLSDQAGISAEIDGDAIKVEQAVEAGKKEAIDLPIFVVNSDYLVALRILVTLNGNIEGLALESEVDVCLVMGETSLCGADLFDCKDYDTWSTDPEALWCGLTLKTDLKGLFLNPPYPVLEMEAKSFVDVCPDTDSTSDAAAASSSAAAPSSDTAAAGTAAPPSAPQETSSGLSGGAIFGIIVAVLILLCLPVCVLWKLKKLPEKLQSKLDANIKLPSKGPRVVDAAVKESKRAPEA